MRRGIILAGGSGTRLYPLTRATSKQLLPVYDKPMIFYPLSVVMMSGIRDVMLITTPEDQSSFKRLLGDGSRYGIRITYAVQPSPDGLAQAFIIGEDFLCGEPSMLVLGDNIFYGAGLRAILQRANAKSDGATVFGYAVRDPERYGVVSFDKNGRVETIEEKPTRPRSRFAVTGLYFYDGRASQFARQVKPSNRGELEITTLNNLYLEDGSLHVELLGRGYAWLDTGTFDSLLSAGEFVRTLSERQDFSIGHLEEIAFDQGWIGLEDLKRCAAEMPNSAYCRYLARMVAEREQT